MAIKFNADNKSKECFTYEPVYTVKGVKSFMGREGYGFECSLYKDGKRLGTVTDTCDGGGMLQMFLKDGEEDALYKYCKTIPAETSEFPATPPPREGEYKGEYKSITIDIDPCIFVGRMVDAFEKDKRDKKDCKTKTLVEVEENGEKVVYAYKCKFSPTIKQKIKDRDYPDKDIVFINEDTCNKRR